MFSLFIKVLVLFSINDSIFYICLGSLDWWCASSCD